ncbi:MAG: HEAT repeat domain-containing protein [Planctomycetota bacterium]
MKFTRNLSLVLVLLPVAAIAAGSSVEDPVTYMGEHVLAKTDVVCLGESAKPVLLPTGARVVRFTLKEVLEGKEEAQSVVLVAGAPDLIPPPGVPGVLFLKRLGRGRYEPVGLVEIFGKEAKARLATLRRYLEIERMAGAKKKRETLREYLLTNLESGDAFLRWSAARELANFTKRNGKYLGPAHLARIRAVREKHGEAVFQQLLDTALFQVKRRGAPPPDAPSHLAGPEGPEYRELRGLYRKWKKGIPKAADRRDLLQRVTSRWLKHSAPILADALDDESPVVRRIAALQLGEGEFTSAEPRLRKRLGEERDREVLEALIHSLGILKSEKALPAILALGKADDLRRAAAFAAARTGGDLAEKWLSTLLATHNRETEKDREIRRLVKFLRSEAFENQEKALSEIRRKRLK